MSSGVKDLGATFNQGGGGGGAVDSVNGQTGVVVLTKSDIGLGNVNNTSDATKNAAVATLQNKVVQLQNGSVTSPSLTFQSDTGLDTGIYTTGDGNLSIAANGVLKVTVNSTGLTVNGDIAANNFPPTGSNNTFAGYDGSGDLNPITGFTIDTTTGGMNENLTLQPNGAVAGYNVNNTAINFEPLQNSPDETYTISNIQGSTDPTSSGFSLGSNGQAIYVLNLGNTHLGTGDLGNITAINNYFNIGNGTDPIDFRGFQYSVGSASINANVTVTNQIQGYVFQPNINAAAILQNDMLAFADFANVGTASQGHTSYFANPVIASVANNHSANGITLNPQITTLTGNAGYTGIGNFPSITTVGATGNVQGVAIGGTITTLSGTSGYTGVNVTPSIGTVGSNTGGYFQGINISPTITTNNNSAVGLNVSMDGVTNAAGAQATLVVQDITYTMNAAGTDGNNITVEYLNTVTAGNEVATLVASQHIQVTIESGVSTATQVKAALDANFTIAANVTTVITGTASNPQVTYAETNLAGGINPGTKKAAAFDGDVSIDGALSFTGGLSIGALNSFASVDISGFPGGVNSIDTLITAPQVPASATMTGVDLLAINTAMLLTVGDNATMTSSFLGYAALGLPAVVSLGTGATVDSIAGAVFAISLDAGAAGGTIDNVNLCRAIGIPNGVTTVNNLYGYKMDLPFGDVGTSQWGLYVTPVINNYMAGSLVVGDTDQPTNSSIAIEIKSTTKAFMNATMTTTERNALTAINGMQIYNTTTDKLQVYAAGSWVDLH